MLDLTPGERRGALMLMVILLLGTAHDLWQARQPSVGLPGGLVEQAGVGQDVAPANAGSSPSPAVASNVPGPVDLNRASAEDLDALPGIGPVLAGRILAQRGALGGFRSPEDLLSVPGIGPKLYARLAPLVRAGGAPDAGGPGSTGPGTQRAEPAGR